MARYTETVAISFNNLRESRVICAEGLVTINQWNGVAFVPTGASLTDESKQLVTQGLRLQFVVDSGAITIEEGGGA